MGTQNILRGGLVALAGLTAMTVLAPGAAQAQSNTLVLPAIDVWASRTGTGITGASTTVITADDIAHSPAQNLTDILAQQTGVQVMHVLGSPTGIDDLIDLRGFGAFAQSNVLVLVNGRRYQDFDLQGFDFASIPLNSIKRIEITRGNSGTVLYGDGAIGGVINIVTKTAPPVGSKARVDGAVGSYGFYQGRFSGATTAGPWSVSAYGSASKTDGYRQNSQANLQAVTTNLSYKGIGWSGHVNFAFDNQRQGLPGGLPNLNTIYPITLDDPRASVTPLDWSKQQDYNLTAGFSRSLSAGVDLIIDGGVRRKYQQAQYYNYFPAPSYTYDASSATPSNYVDTVMTTASFTPRLKISHRLFRLPNKLLAGFDLYNTQYNSDRPVQEGGTPVHAYDIRQTTLGVYAMNTTTVLPDLDLSFGGRLQRDIVKGSDAYNAAVDPNAGFYASDPQAPDVDSAEWQYAAHFGYEFRVNPMLTLFGRVGRGFRLPNADERVGSGNPYSVSTPASLDLKTQTSYDVEDGLRLKSGPFSYQTSVYVMYLNNEIHYIPAEYRDVNLDPTRRLGWENSATYALTNDLRLRGALAYTRATFREGTWAGNDIPLVSRWSGNVGLTWNVLGPKLVFDVDARFFGKRRMDNDQANTQPEIPANATVDVKLGGKQDRFFWSFAVQNLLDRQYFDYAIASATTQGYYNAYPQPGRTFLFRAGVNLD